MAARTLMQRLARWHIWLGWVAALPILLWLASGLFMALRPIEEVRGEHLRIETKREPVRVALSEGESETLIRDGRLLNQRGRSILLVTHTDGSVARIDLTDRANTPLPPVDEAEARRAVAAAIKGGDKVVSVRLFEADQAPLDFRKPIPAWRVELADGTYVYIGRMTGEIEAIRTRWWRIYDFLWGLHIMDPVGRENAYNPFVWVFGALALLLGMLGAILLFRRRKTRPSA